MLFPIKTEVALKRRPVVTQALLVANMLVYLIMLLGTFYNLFGTGQFTNWGHFHSENFVWWQLLTYQFLHSPYDLLHLLFNMVFLWIFGCAVEDRMGRIGFLAFYLIGGIVAAVVHGAWSSSPVIGASGSIAAVTGAFLVLFPRSRVRVVLVFFLIGIYQIPSLWLILLYFVIDLLSQTTQLVTGNEARVAYLAHIAGYVYGFSLAMLLLATKLVKSTDFDLLFIWSQARRRAAFRRGVDKQKGTAWEGPPAKVPATMTRETQGDAKPTAALASVTPEQEAAARAKAQISALIRKHELPEAAARYKALLEVDPEATLSEANQLDLASQLCAENENETAAMSYELFLQRYQHSPQMPQVRLMLAVLYIRRLKRPERARRLLKDLAIKLKNESQQKLARGLSREIGPG